MATLTRLLLPLLLLVAGCAGAQHARLDPGPPELLLMRTVTLEDDRGRAVVLPAMCHIGEAAFYDEVGRAVAGCDVVFLEGVGGDDAAEVAPVVTDRLVAEVGAYPTSAAWLGLVPQVSPLPHVDPARARNADMTWDELLAQATPQEKAKLVATEGDEGPVDPQAAELAQALLEGLLTRANVADTTVTEREEDDPTIIGARNRKVAEAALRALDEPGVRSVAVVYGAGHQRGLVSLFEAAGFAVAEERWLRVFEVDDRDGRAPTAFGEDDVVVVRGEGFAFELAWAGPSAEALRDRLTRGDLGPLERVAFCVGDGLLVRSLDRRPAVEVVTVSCDVMDPEAQQAEAISISRAALDLPGGPVGLIEVQPRLAPPWCLTLTPTAAPRLRLRVYFDEQTARLSLPPTRGAMTITVERAKNRDGRALLGE
jgi:hypothetical protein